MYKIDKSINRISKIRPAKFKELGFTERANLQEWIANLPTCLNEELLIIQKEFAQFNDTKERLDLLALDKQGNLVVIENKLDDTGKDVTWQVLKYASYCSTLTPTQIVNIFNDYLDRNGNTETAEDILTEFFSTQDFREKLNNGASQRIIMVGGEFPKEVTSTAMWLLNYGLRIQCFKATAYEDEAGQLFLNMEQIIPIKEAEEFVISMANKSKEEVEAQEKSKGNNQNNLKFWTEFLKRINTKTKLYRNVSPSKENWIGAGSGTSFLGFNSIATQKYIRIELYFNSGDKDNNKRLFDFLHQKISEIETSFGNPLVWERKDDKVTCRIKYELPDVNISNFDDWDKMISFMEDAVPKFETAFNKPIQELSKIK
jgi:Domain of unknown function (DUF4268)